MLKIDHLSKYYRIAGKKTAILSDISLDVGQGEIVAIKGKSGSGKSTFLNVISGITHPSRGKVFLNDKKIHYFLDIFSSRVRNRHIGFIFQTFRLLPGETVLTNVLMPAMIMGHTGKSTRKYAMELLEKMGMKEFYRTRAGILSGGQKQRVAIARALINRPGLILADEPTANLDRQTSSEIGAILEGLAAEGRAVLTVTHQDNLFKNCGRVYELKNGVLGAIECKK
jgi:putative ABC transport system ATP-binding protein